MFLSIEALEHKIISFHKAPQYFDIRRHGAEARHKSVRMAYVERKLHVPLMFELADGYA